MNRNGQIGKTITSVVVLFWVAVIIAAFIFLSASARVLKNPASLKINGISDSAGENLLLKEIQVDVDGRQEKMLVFDYIVRKYPAFNEDEVLEVLKPIFIEKNNCFALLLLSDGKEIFKGYRGVVFNGDEVEYRPLLAASIKGKVVFSKIKDNDVEIESAYGSCAELGFAFRPEDGGG